MVSVAFYQVLRTTVPVFTVLIYRVIFGRTYENMTYLTLVPIMIGAALTTAGEYTFTDLGFLLTFAGVMLAAVKVCYFGSPITRPSSELSKACSSRAESPVSSIGPVVSALSETQRPNLRPTDPSVLPPYA